MLVAGKIHNDYQRILPKTENGGIKKNLVRIKKNSVFRKKRLPFLGSLANNN